MRTALRYGPLAAFGTCKEGLMLSLRRLGAVAAFALALALTVVAPAGATSPEPTIKHCHWWPGTTEVHWDTAYLLDVYGVNHVERVTIFWSGGLFGTGSASIVPHSFGHHVSATTLIGALSARAELVLGGGRTVPVDSRACVNGNS